MFNRIVVNVIHVPLEIDLITDRVLPESLLPHAAQAFAPLAGRDASFTRITLQIGSGEGFFYLPPTHGEVCVSGRERPKTVHVVRQEDDGVKLERAARSYVLDGLVEKVSGSGILEHWPASIRNQREEERPAGNERSSVPRHEIRSSRMSGLGTRPTWVDGKMPFMDRARFTRHYDAFVGCVIHAPTFHFARWITDWTSFQKLSTKNANTEHSPNDR